MSWFFLTLIAFLFFGVQNFLYKVSAAKGLHSRTVTFYFVLFSTIIVWTVLIVRGIELRVSRIVIGLAVADAIGFYITTVTRLEALRCIPVHLAFPILRFSTVLVAFCGVFFFGEAFSWQLAVALVLVLISAWLISAERKQDRGFSPHYGKGLFLIAVSLVFSAGINVVTKLAAENTQLLDYMAIANTFIIAFSLIEIRMSTGERVRLPNKQEFNIAVALAIANLIAWYSYLLALRSGPLNTTAVIAGMGFIVPIILAIIVYRERLTTKRIWAILCAVLVVGLLKS